MENKYWIFLINFDRIDLFILETHLHPKPLTDFTAKPKMNSYLARHFPPNFIPTPDFDKKK
jgi:hypothetical protein